MVCTYNPPNLPTMLTPILISWPVVDILWIWARLSIWREKELQVKWLFGRSRSCCWPSSCRPPTPDSEQREPSGAPPSWSGRQLFDKTNRFWFGFLDFLSRLLPGLSRADLPFLRGKVSLLIRGRIQECFWKFRKLFCCYMLLYRNL